MRLRLGSPSSVFLSTLVLISGCGGGSDGGKKDQGVADMGSSHHDMTSGSDGGTGSDGGSDDGGGSVPSLSLVAGGLGGFGNVNGVGARARFYNPTGVALDDVGNVYVSDSSTHTIRKIDITQGGLVTTLAGVSDQSGSDDGTGSAARFNTPQGLAFAVVGQKKNLYVADTNNYTIRVVDITNGVVSTLAGSAGNLTNFGETGDGTGTDAHFTSPTGVAVDGDGTNLYVTDTDAQTIRKVNINSQEVTTIAGDPGVQNAMDCTNTSCVATDSNFSNPAGLTFVKDSGGNDFLYVLDTGFGITKGIRQVFIANHRVLTMKKGSSPIEFDSPYGIAMLGGKLYISLSSNHTIQQVDLTTLDVTLVAGSDSQPGSSDGTGAAALFNGPGFMAFDGASNLYVADGFNYTIRKVVTTGAETGKVTTVAGSALHDGAQDGTGAGAHFSSPGGVIGDGHDTLYVADSTNNTIRKIVISTGVVTTLAGAAGQYPDSDSNGDGNGDQARFNFPEGLAYVESGDGKKHLYVADNGSYLIRQVDLDTQGVTTVAGSPNQLPDSGNGDGTGAGALFYGPSGLVNDGADTLYVADSFSSIVRKVVISSKVVTTVIDKDKGLSGPTGVALDGHGNLYVSDTFNSVIRRLNLTTGTLDILAGSPGEVAYVDATGAAARFNSPGVLACDSAGTLYVTDSGNHAVRTVDTANGKVSTFVGAMGSVGVSLGALPASLNNPIAVGAIGPSTVAISDENSIVLAHP